MNDNEQVLYRKTVEYILFQDIFFHSIELFEFNNFNVILLILDDLIIITNL